MEISEILATGGAGSVSFAVIITLLRMLEKRHEKREAARNGGDIYTRIVLLENKVVGLTDEVNDVMTKLHTFHRDLCEWREDMRLHFARVEAKEEARKEILREAAKEIVR
ncbi:hypothetical protein CMI37_32070 [Candidatus Pacearchaeota archaeon]|nr:hypothetical protein [Candidatus Pacearchaeota archaeon]|tara:strand:- start:2376 stop:2705 length:330 start_codon:yes stop_codon:yes gene_type:complete